MGLVLAAMASEGLVWDNLPKAVYQDEPCHLSWRGVQATSAHWEDRALPLIAREDVGQEVVFTPGGGGTFSARGSSPIQVMFVAPQDDAALSLDEAGRLQANGLPAVLIHKRRDDTGERGWSLLKGWGAAPDKERQDHVLMPMPAPWGESPLLRQIMALQAEPPPTGSKVVLFLSSQERLVGWIERDFRQSLGWLVAKLYAADCRVVLVQIPTPSIEKKRTEGLWKQVRDLGSAFTADVVEVVSLCDRRYWEQPSGAIGPGLNETGQDAFRNLLRQAGLPADVLPPTL